MAGLDSKRGRFRWRLITRFSGLTTPADYSYAPLEATFEVKFTIRFAAPYQLGPFRDAIDMIFPYEVVPSALVGSPEERSSTRGYHLNIGISRTLASCWNLHSENLTRVLFEYGRRYVAERIRERSLSDQLELWLTTATHPQTCPFDPAGIPSPADTEMEVEEGVESLGQRMTGEATAAAIIEARDNINALYHHKYGSNLIVLVQERDILQLFLDCTSQEELAFRLAALRNAAVNLNLKSLRQVAGVANPKVQSLDLLERYLANIPGYHPRPIQTLRALNKIRQGFPVHTDRASGIIDALKHLGITYPAKDTSAAWQQILSKYRDALNEILTLVRRDVFPNEGDA